MIRAVMKAKAIFDCFDHDHTAMTLDELSRYSKMPKATTVRVVKTMESCGFLIRVESQYCLSPKIFRLANLVQNNLGIVELAHPILQQVARRARETVTLNTRSQFVRIVADVVQIQAPLMTVARQGQQVSLLYGATGRILMAFMEDAERAELIRRLPKAERAKAEQDLSRFRTQGYATSDGQRIKGLSSVAVPIFSGNGRVNYCLAVTGPSIRMHGRTQELIDLMLAAGYEISEKLRATEVKSIDPPSRQGSEKTGRSGSSRAKSAGVKHPPRAVSRRAKPGH